MNLTELTAATTRTRTLDNLTMQSSYAVGAAGHQRSYRGTSGDKLHLLRVDTIIADSSATPGWKEYNGKTFRVMTTGDQYSIYSPCNGNGQHTGVVRDGSDLSDITCSKCLRALDKIIAAAS